jgi:hypothetical protein
VRPLGGILGKLDHLVKVSGRFIFFGVPLNSLFFKALVSLTRSLVRLIGVRFISSFFFFILLKFLEWV